MQVGDLVQNRNSESGRLGIITKVGCGKYLISWLDGHSNWCIPPLLEVVNASR